MPRTTAISRGIFLSLTVSLLLAEGCAVFNAVGDTISTVYENMTTYFNVYYNARRLFNDAENEIKTAARANEGKPLPPGQTLTIPAGAQKNLDLVIDKCSNILAYHSTSSFVKDALMMTGKAFYYKREFSKAERKFLELITRYPQSSLVLEAQLWYARSEQMLDDYKAARTSAEALIASAEQADDRDILAEAYALEASLNEHDNAVDGAIEFYEKSAKAADNDELKADAWSKIGELDFDQGQFHKSIDALVNVDEYSDDPYQIFQSQLLIVRAYHGLRLLDKAMTLANEMLNDYRFKDYLGAVQLERATILLDGGRSTEAVDVLRALDTLQAKTETGTLASFELGKYYEQTVGDYAKAKEYYARAASVQGIQSAEQAAKKATALKAYFAFWNDLIKADSLYALSTREDSVAGALTAEKPPLADSSSTAADSLKSPRPQPRVVMTMDSVNAVKARVGAGLGELFYTDLANPDSAFHWYKYSLEHQYTEHNSPRILYILAELAASYPSKSAFTPDQYRAQLVKDFPNSYFARQVQNLSVDESALPKVTDSAQEAYDVAEGLIESGKNDDAVTALRAIIAKYPESPVIPRCRYAIGWLFENRFAEMDSAAAQYKLLLAEYPNTSYAKAVGSRVLDTLSLAPSKIDSTSAASAPRTEANDSVKTARAGELTAKPGIPKTPGHLSRRAKVLQSQSLKKNER
jgi:TolA-binding protein